MELYNAVFLCISHMVLQCALILGLTWLAGDCTIKEYDNMVTAGIPAISLAYEEAESERNCEILIVTI